MLNWLGENLATIFISLGLLGIVGAIIRSQIKNKRKGKSPCGCGCSNCALQGNCQTKNDL